MQINMELQILKKQNLLGREITVYGTKEEPLFLAKDVAEWIEHNNATLMVNTVDDDEKKLDYVIDSSGQRRKSIFLTENGLYEVLMQSRKPIAKEYKKAVKHILREIRLNGGFIASFENDSPELIMARALQVAANTIENFKIRNNQLERTAEFQQRQLESQKPIVELAKECYSSTETMTASIISARLGFKSAIAFNKKLKELGIQYKIKGDDCWKLTSKYALNGYTKTIPYPYVKSDGSTGTHNQMEWTEKGFVFLRNIINKKIPA